MIDLRYNEEWVRVRGERKNEEKWVMPSRELSECAIGKGVYWNEESGISDRVYVRWPVGDCRCGVTCVSWFDNSKDAWSFMTDKMYNCKK